jgi:tetratricopeptide (TPR) repeat protein
MANHPEIVFGYGNLASVYFFLDRFPEAESILQRASERRLEVPRLLVMRYNIALLNGDQDRMDRIVALAKGRHAAEHLLAHAEALALARYGRLQAARRSSKRAEDLVSQAGNYEDVAIYRAVRAVWEAACGNVGDARRNGMSALALSRGRDVQYTAGLALGLLGDTAQLEARADDLEKYFPEDTFVKFTYAPVLRALVALRHGKPAESVERLEIARQYELAPNSLNFTNFYFGGLHSAYVRGEAFMAGHRLAEAASEFQKILDHRGIVGADPIGVLAHLQLARVFVLSGDKAKAKTAYEAFLALWKDADPDIQILKSAKAEYDRL